MNVNPDRRLPSSRAACSPAAQRCSPALATRLRRSTGVGFGFSLSLLGLAAAAFIACGGSSEAGNDEVPGFSGPGATPSGSGGTSSTLPGAAGTTSTPACTPGAVGCPPASSETNNPNLPVNPDNGQLGSTSCTPNAASCNGNLLQRCDGAGVALAPQDCAVMGGSCGVVAGVASCVAPSCTPGAATCATANTVSTCAAGGMLDVTRCPNGTNCTGAGQCTPVACNPAAMLSSNNAGATIYFFGQGTDDFGDVACGFGIRVGADDGTGNPNNANNGVGDAVNGIENPAMFAALATGSYQMAGACGACAEINYQGRSVRVTVADECPANVSINAPCRENASHMDLSRAAWNALTNNAPANRINGGITWRFVPCNLTSNVQFELSKPDDVYWNEFVVVGHRYPIVRAEVMMEDGPAPGSDDGRWVDATRQNYNYWRPPEGNPDGDMGTYRVRVTDINGSIIEEQLELRGGLQGGTGQFGCQ